MTTLLRGRAVRDEDVRHVLNALPVAARLVAVANLRLAGWCGWRRA